MVELLADAYLWSNSKIVCQVHESPVVVVTLVFIGDASRGQYRPSMDKDTFSVHGVTPACHQTLEIKPMFIQELDISESLISMFGSLGNACEVC